MSGRIKSSGNKLQRQKKGPWSLGEKRVKVRRMGGVKEGEGKSAGVLGEGEWGECAGPLS